MVLPKSKTPPEKSGPGRSWFNKLWIVAIIVFCGLSWSCQQRPVRSNPGLPEVTVVAPTLKRVQAYEDFSGRVEATETVDVKARVTGFLSQVHFQEGADIQAGDLLYTIDPREYQAEVNLQFAVLQQAQARLLQAQSDLERAKRLRTETAISVQELEKQTTLLREAEAAVRSSQANLDKARLNLEFTEIRAPISGKIGRTGITAGNLVEDGDSLTTIVSQNPIYVYFDVPERVILNWDRATKHIPDATVATTTKIRIGVASEEDFPRLGKLDFTDNAVNQGTGTLQMRAALPNEDRRLQPGMFARVRMMLNEPTEVMLIPDRAIGSDQGQRFVFVLGKDNKVEYRAVKLGQIYDGLRAILEGLQPNDEVVVEGLQALRQGVQVAPVAPEIEPVTQTNLPATE